MNRFRRPPRKPSKLSESVHHQLNAYALAATAAGVGMLALAPSAEAKIVYTPAHIKILPLHQNPLDLNHDGVVDFSFTNFGGGRSGSYSLLRIRPLPPTGGNAIVGMNNSFNSASALPPRFRIGPTGQRSHTMYMAGWQSNGNGQTNFVGQWANGGKGVKDRYLGLKFIIKGKVHFGWARLNVTVTKGKTVGGHLSGLITGYAYETIPNKPIIAGKTHGEDDIDPGSGASLTSPIPDTPQPSLGALALGAPGLSIWRREESVGAG